MELDNLTKALTQNGYEVSYFPGKEDAAVYLDRSIEARTVGIGDSVTLLSLGLYERLLPHNRAVYSPAHSRHVGEFREIAKKCVDTEIFLTSVNAMSQDGQMVNIDAIGNRVAASLYGHEKVYFVVGINKVVPTLEDAVWRARNIAAPQNAKRHGFQTPCAVRGDRCYNCSSPARICNGMIIHMKKMDFIQMEVVLIGEALGL